MLKFPATYVSSHREVRCEVRGVVLGGHNHVPGRHVRANDKHPMREGGREGGRESVCSEREAARFRPRGGLVKCIAILLVVTGDARSLPGSESGARVRECRVWVSSQGWFVDLLARARTGWRRRGPLHAVARVSGGGAAVAHDTQIGAPRISFVSTWRKFPGTVVSTYCPRKSAAATTRVSSLLSRQ